MRLQLLIYPAAAAICVWNLVRGIQTGNMHFGVSTVSIDAKRSSDPRGFWIYAFFNAASVPLVAIGLLRAMNG